MAVKPDELRFLYAVTVRFLTTGSTLRVSGGRAGSGPEPACRRRGAPIGRRSRTGTRVGSNDAQKRPERVSMPLSSRQTPPGSTFSNSPRALNHAIQERSDPCQLRNGKESGLSSTVATESHDRIPSFDGLRLCALSRRAGRSDVTPIYLTVSSDRSTSAYTMIGPPASGPTCGTRDQGTNPATRRFCLCFLLRIAALPLDRSRLKGRSRMPSRVKWLNQTTSLGSALRASHSLLPYDQSTPRQRSSSLFAYGHAHNRTWSHMVTVQVSTEQRMVTYGH